MLTVAGHKTPEYKGEIPMVNIRKPFDVVSAEALAPGDLISGIVNTAPALGIVINPLLGGQNVIVMDIFNNKKSVFLGYHALFGSSCAIRYNGTWSIAPSLELYSISKMNDSSAFDIGAIEIAYSRSTMYVGRGQNMYDDVRIDLASLEATEVHPKTGQYTVALNWELWLDSERDKPDAKPLYAYSASPSKE